VYSLKQAADAVGRGKPAILKAIKSGRISAWKDAFGQWQIDPAEPDAMTRTTRGH
jgi:hypothetical protein